MFLFIILSSLLMVKSKASTTDRTALSKIIVDVVNLFRIEHLQ